MAPSASPGVRALTRALLASTALAGVGLGLGLVPLCLLPSPLPVHAEPLPTGGQVVSGGVTIGAPSGNALAITQSSQTAIVNWQGFSVGPGHRVDIRQPNASAAILNRVTGATPSTIAGQLNANGQVYLVNPNGVTITRTGQVRAAGFVASSLGITDEDFKAGRRAFRGSGASAAVTNHGAITIGRGGYAALIGGQVANTGTISVPMGRVGLGSGERATLDLSGDGFLQVAVPTGAKGRGALVEHAGTIAAEGGSVTLTAAAARDMARQAVNLSGVVEARSVSGHDGRITLSGGAGAVAVTATGRLDASGRDGASGGRVRIAGGRLDLAGTVDVSGAAGGRVRLKAGEHLALSGHVLAEGRGGRGGRVAATAPAIATHAALIDASGAAGGGTVKVGGGFQGTGRLAHAARVSVDAATTLRADATATGDGGSVVVWSDAATRFAGTITARGGAGGDGGAAEVSSHGVLAYAGFADLTAPGGRFGTLLLDPYDVTISTGADANQSGFTATGTGSVIGSTTLLTALGGANVAVSTGTAGTQGGTITLAAGTPLAWNTGATLTLQAAGAVVLNSAVTAQAGGLTIAAGSGTSTATADLSVARFTLASGTWVQNAATLPGFATGDFQVAGGAFLRAAGGSGTGADPYRLTDIYGVQGMGTSAALLAANYRLAADIDATGTATWNGGQGFQPVGNAGTPFRGVLDGAAHTITGLTIARPSQNYVGLIGSLGRGGSVSGLGLVGGSVSGDSNVGGLVGSSNGTVSQSYASGSVSGSGGGTAVGGLVGANYIGGTVTQSYASGSVSGSDSVGGLVGGSFGMVSQSYATGSVSGKSAVGGLVGYNNGTVLNAYWDTQTTGQANGVGTGSASGATGLTTAQARTASSYNGFDFSTVWYQAGNMRPILRSEAAAPVGGVIPVSNLHQLQLVGANVSGSYQLTRDLDAGATASTDASPGIWGAGGFVPIGNMFPTLTFTGRFDGSGHIVSNLTIARGSEDYVGLIGYVGSGGMVTNIGLAGGSVSGGGSVGGLVGTNGGTVSNAYATAAVTGTGFSVGGLVGVNGGTVENAYASGAVTGSYNVGGLVGRNDGVMVSNAYAAGAVTGSNNVGGLVGLNGSAVKNAYATAAVSGSGRSVGGLVGANLGSVENAYASGAVTGSYNVGGLVGGNSGTLTNTIWDTQTTRQGANGVGQGVSAGATGLTTTEARTQAGYPAFDFAGKWYQAGDLRPMLRALAAAPGADGVIPVSNLYQLQLLGTNLGSSYRLTRDLDASATAGTDASGIWGAGGFVPVGSEPLRFTGGLDGAGHIITGLTIARPSDFVGLIGSLGGTVMNIGLVGGSVSGGGSVGGLVGFNSGTVRNAYATAAVTGTGVSSNAGGLVGWNNDGGTVENAYATGAVTNSGPVAGGLVGFNSGTVRNAYATAAVTGTGLSSNVGGLVGWNNDGGTVENAYATGAVSGSIYVGGLIGTFVSGAVSNAYWDTQTTGRSIGTGFGSTAGATGRTTAQMQDLTAFRTTYAGFDFDTVWAPPNRAGQGGQGTASYPLLYALSNVVAVTPAGSRTYGSGGAPVATYAGLRPGDFVTTLGGLGSGVTATSDVGSYAVTASGTAVTGAAGTAYRILYVPGTLTITPATITVAGATGVNKTYDGTTALPGGSTGFTSACVLFGDAVTVSAGSAAYDSARAGTRSVIVSGLSLGGAKAGNYRLSTSSVAGSGTIDPAALTVFGVSALGKIYDGTAAATLAGTPSIQPMAGDVVAIGGVLTGAFASKNVGTGLSVVLSGVSLTGPDAGNYRLSLPTLSAAIAPATLTYTANAASRSYGAANPGLGGTVTGFVAGETQASATTGTLTFTTTATAGTDVGSSDIQGRGLSANNGNYRFVQATGYDTALTITPATLTVAGAKTYDTTAGFTAGQLTVTGAMNGETVTLTQGAGTAASADAGSYAGITLPGLAIWVSGGNARASNYRLPLTGTLTITPATVTVEGATGLTKTYDGTTALPAGATGFTSTGLYASDAGRVGITASAVYDSPNAGSRTVVVTGLGLTGAAAGNYRLSVNGASGSATSVNGSGAIDPATLTVAGAKTYDTTAGFTAGQLTVTDGAVTGETVTVAQGVGTAASADAGSDTGGRLSGLAIQVAGGSALASNYRLPATGTLIITPAPITVTANSGTSVYGDAPVDPGLSATGLQGGQTVGVLTGLSTSFGLTAATGVAGSPYTLTVAGTLTNGNYTVTARTSGRFVVAARPITVTADAQTRLYGDANPVLTYMVGGRGLVTGDGLSGGLATLADATSGVGSYAIAQGSLTASANYAVTYRGADLTITPRPVTLSGTRAYDAGTGIAGGLLTVADRVNGDTVAVSGSGTLAGADVGLQALTDLSGLRLSNANYTLDRAGGAVAITPAAITVTANSGTSVYGDTPVDPGLSATGLQGGQGVGVLTGLSTSFGIDAATGAGRYGLTVAGALRNGNYTVTARNDGTWRVDPRPLTLTAQVQTRPYGEANPALTYTVGGRGLVNGDRLTGGLTTAAEAASPVAAYAIEQGTLDASANYAVSYVGAELTVGRRPVTVTADAQTRIYGDANPALTYTTTALGAGAALSGGLATAATASADVGGYAITEGSLTAAANPNYALTYRGATLTVAARPITVTADAQTRRYGDADPSLTYRVGGRGLVAGDALSGGLATDAAAGSGIGRYAITQGTLAASPNYALTYQGAGLTVTPRPVTLSGTRVYDAGAGIDGGLLTVANRVNGDAVTVSGSGTLAGRDVGLQALRDISGLALSNANYTLTAAGGAVTITPATLTYTADAARRSYGAVNPVLGGTVTGFLGPDTPADAITGSARFTTAAGTGSHVGAYAVTGSGLTAGNYVFAQAAGNAGALTVDPAGLTVAGTKTYDATAGFRVGHLTVGGGVNGETLTLTAGSGLAPSADAGLYVDGSLTGLSLSVAGGNGSAANYRLPTTGTLTIAPATIGLRANDGRSVYGDRPLDPGFSVTGLVDGQDAGVLTGLATGFTLDGASAAGRYSLAVVGRLTNGNYRIGTSEAGRYTIERRPITVTADPLSRVYGEANPALTYTVGGLGLVNGDRLTGGLATAAGATSGVGTYAIAQGTLAASANYAVTYRGANLTVTARPITVIANPQARPAGTTNPALTYAVGGRGLVAGDRLTGALATTAEAESEPGVYAITQGSLAASANYRLGFVGADLTVLPAPAAPGPLPVALDASRLASTAERAARLDGRPVAPELPLLLGGGPAGRLVAADPRFEGTLVCTGQQGGCFLAPPVILTVPKPQASLPAPAR